MINASLNSGRESCQLDLDQQEIFEQIVARYEHNWHRDHSTNWRDYLPDNPKLRNLLLAELPLIEAEFKAATASVIHPPELTTLSGSSELSQAASAQKANSSTTEQLEPEFKSSSNYHSVVRQIRGGLGDVFVIRDEQLDRVVVVKQLRSRWLGNAKAVRAFEREVRITSQLEHPSIVPVHSFGTTPDGRPFYCMRYIEGQTLQEVIDQLHSQERFDLASLRGLLTHYIQICRTVAFAGSRGVIHRDIKPSNIIVGSFGQSLLLDWGLAKELQRLKSGSEAYPHGSELESNEADEGEELLLDTDRHFTETQLVQTAVGDVVGTPAFMSPEQAAGRTCEFSLRTDVFGLGTVLYACLFGKPPYGGKNAADTIRLAEAGQVDFSAAKSADRSYLGLVAICRKAMSPRIEDRYPDAQTLADEVERWMSGESVSACRQPMGNRLIKFASRQRTLAWTAGLLMMVAIASVFIGSLAVQAERNQRIIAANNAQAHAQVAANVAEYLAKVFRSAEPLRFDDPGFINKDDSSARATLRQMLDAGYDTLRTDLVQHHQPYGDLLMSLGTSYRGLGDFQRAKELLNEAKLVRVGSMGAEHPQALEAEYQLCRLAYDSGEYEDAESRLRQLIRTIGQQLQQIDPTDDHATHQDLELLLANVKFNLGWVLFFQPLGLEMPQFQPECVTESQSLFRDVIAIRRRLLPHNHRSIGLAYAGLASAQFCMAETQKEAVVNAATAMEIFNQSGEERSLGNFMSEYQRAENLRRAMQYDEAEKLYLKLDEFIVKQVGEKHLLPAIHRWNMVGFYRKFGKTDKAESLIREIRSMACKLAILRTMPAHLDGLRQYADALVEAERTNDALEVYQEILRAAEEQPGKLHEFAATARARLTSLQPMENN